MVFLDDGIENNLVEVKFSNNLFTIRKEIKAESATIIITYQANDLMQRGVRIIASTNKNSYIKFLSTNPDENNPLLKYQLKNGIDEIRCSEFYHIKKYCKHELDINDFFNKEYIESKSDSALNLYNLSSVNLALKQMEFLKKQKKLGDYYIWFFKTNIANTLKKTHKKELLDFFDSYIPTNFQHSEYGMFLRDRLEANLNVKEGEKAPLFASVGYLGDSIILENFKGKYVLIDFWATWCIPCMEKIPELKKIRREYDSSLLQIISVSYDKDSIKCAKAIKDYNMNWVHIFNDSKIINAYGDRPIPSLYLVNPKGIICYSSWESSIERIYEILTKSN